MPGVLEAVAGEAEEDSRGAVAPVAGVSVGGEVEVEVEVLATGEAGAGEGFLKAAPPVAGIGNPIAPACSQVASLQHNKCSQLAPQIRKTDKVRVAKIRKAGKATDSRRRTADKATGSSSSKAGRITLPTTMIIIHPAMGAITVPLDMAGPMRPGP